MRGAASAIIMLALTASTPSVAAIYDFTIELPASPGVTGRGVAPMVRLTFALDTAQAMTGPTFYSTSTTVYPSVPVTVFTYPTASTKTVDYYLGIGPYSLDLTDYAFVGNDTYVLDSHPTQLSTGIGTGITITTGSLPADYVDFIGYRRQNGTMTIALAAPTGVPEVPSWTILSAALGMVAGLRRRRHQ